MWAHMEHDCRQGKASEGSAVRGKGGRRQTVEVGPKQKEVTVHWEGSPGGRGGAGAGQPDLPVGDRCEVSFASEIRSSGRV